MSPKRNNLKILFLFLFQSYNFEKDRMCWISRATILVLLLGIQPPLVYFLIKIKDYSLYARYNYCITVYSTF